jgi:hypothetical protein
VSTVPALPIYTITPTDNNNDFFFYLPGFELVHVRVISYTRASCPNRLSHEYFFTVTLLIYAFNKKHFPFIFSLLLICANSFTVGWFAKSRFQWSFRRAFSVIGQLGRWVAISTPASTAWKIQNDSDMIYQQIKSERGKPIQLSVAQTVREESQFRYRTPFICMESSCAIRCSTEPTVSKRRLNF